MLSSDTEFEREFAARFGDTAWLIVFGEDYLTFDAEIEFQDRVEDGLVEMWAWPTHYKNFVFRINPKNVVRKDDQWEFVNTLDDRRWAIRAARVTKDGEARG
jgi:hypothetical protein